MLRVIGIDFGTSTTYMNVKRYDGDKPLGDKFNYIPVTFNYGASKGCVETVVRENGDGSFDCGDVAKQELENSVTYIDFKMELENNDNEKRTNARRVTELFFRYLYENYLQQIKDMGENDDEVETIVSYPVKWKQETRDFMINAARKAGFPNVKGMDEATAAVFTVLSRQMEEINREGLIYANEPGYLLLVDMGAGTTDLVVCRYNISSNNSQPLTVDAISTETVACWPMDIDAPTFGGREIDTVLADYVEDFLKGCNVIQDPAIIHSFAHSPGSAKKWKEEAVSVALAKNDAVTTCGYVSMMSGGKKINPIDRAAFESLIKSGIADYAELLNGCLEYVSANDPAFAEKGLDLVILTGGHSAWYFAQEIIDGSIPGFVNSNALDKVRANKKRVMRLSNPQATVALGLIYSKLPYQVKEVKNPPTEESSLSKDKTGTVKDKTVELYHRIAKEYTKRYRFSDEFRESSAIISDDSKDLIFYHASKEDGSFIKICQQGLYLFGNNTQVLQWDDFIIADLNCEPPYQQIGWNCTVNGEKIAVDAKFGKVMCEYLSGLQQQLSPKNQDKTDTDTSTTNEEALYAQAAKKFTTDYQFPDNLRGRIEHFDNGELFFSYSTYHSHIILSSDGIFFDIQDLPDHNLSLNWKQFIEFPSEMLINSISITRPMRLICFRQDYNTIYTYLMCLHSYLAAPTENDESNNNQESFDEKCYAIAKEFVRTMDFSGEIQPYSERRKYEGLLNKNTRMASDSKIKKIIDSGSREYCFSFGNHMYICSKGVCLNFGTFIDSFTFFPWRDFVNIGITLNNHLFFKGSDLCVGGVTMNVLGWEEHLFRILCELQDILKENALS